MWVKSSVRLAPGREVCRLPGRLPVLLRTAGQELGLSPLWSKPSWDKPSFVSFTTMAEWASDGTDEELGPAKTGVNGCRATGASLREPTLTVKVCVTLPSDTIVKAPQSAAASCNRTVSSDAALECQTRRFVESPDS